MSFLSLANGTRVPLKNGFVLGRVAGCDLVIDDTKASRRHARIVIENDVVEIEDMGSSNGTLLNDKPVTRRLLRDGDRVQIGKTVIVFHDGELPAASGAVAASATAAAPAAPKPNAPALDDDDDLFGSAPAASRGDALRAEPARAVPLSSAPPSAPPAAAPPAPPPASRPAPPAPAVAAPRAVAPPSSPIPPAAPPPPAPPPRPAVVEFADEVVEVRRPAPAAAPAPKAAPPAADATAIGTSSRILQYSKQAQSKGGLLGDDVSQLGGGTRALIYAGVLAGAAAIVWFIVHAMR